MAKTRVLQPSGIGCASLTWLVALYGCMGMTPVSAQAIQSGTATLSFPVAQSGGRAVAVTAGRTETQALAPQPVRILVCGPCSDETSPQTPVGKAYGSVRSQSGGVLATAQVTSPSGSVFNVSDLYQAAPQPGAFTLSRTVTVAKADAADQGFNSEFAIGFANPLSLDQYHFLAPAIWYDHNKNASPKGFAADYANSYFYWRETRSGLPFVMMQDPTAGTALSIAHVAATPTTGIDETVRAWVVDASVQNGSLGAQKVPRTALGFLYPTQETGAGSATTTGSTWVRRSHPVQAGFSHRYTLAIALDHGADTQGQADYATALRRSWRRYFQAFDPTIYRLPMPAVYRDGIALLNTYWANNNGAPGFPFNVKLPGGAVISISYLMGFTGEQIPLGYQLFRHGVLAQDTTSLTQGQAILDFWATRAAQSSGLPLATYNVTPPTFRNNNCKYPVFLRNVTDGMEGMVEAAAFGRQHGMPHPAWESFAQAFGDWLIGHQNKDGSFYRAYNPDSSVFTNTNTSCNPNGFGYSKLNTTHAVRFLVMLYLATGKQAYLDAAVAAGDFALAAIYGPTQYVGGTLDNPNVIDKEAGVLALHAALALFDATHQIRWLEAARKAADYMETWSYAWRFPVASVTPNFAKAGPLGLGLIATGQSSADISLSRQAYELFRLSLFADGGDDHYLRAARFLQNDTKLTTQLTGVGDQRYGFAHDGLVGEGVTLAFQSYVDSGSSTNWFPWLTDAEVDPLVRLTDTFGSPSIVDDAAQPYDRLRYENTHVYPAAGSIGWGTPTAAKP